jgi:hypothetical protein
MLLEERPASALEVGQTLSQACLFRRPQATQQLCKGGLMRCDAGMSQGTTKEHARDEDVDRTSAEEVPGILLFFLGQNSPADTRGVKRR